MKILPKVVGAISERFDRGYHLARHPQDNTAKRQLEWLENVLDVEPLPIGNSALTDWGLK